jgi:site-specific recombinase XerD
LKTKISLEQNLIQNFIFASQIEGKSARTIERYEGVLKPFFAQTNKNPLEITPQDVREHLGHLDTNGYAKATLWTVYKNLHVFYEFLRREGYLKVNPVSIVVKPKIPKVFPKVLTDAEIRGLLFAAKSSNDRFLKKRNFALVCLLFDSGLRASELCGLKLGDVSLENQLVKVYGKGSKERVVPFSSETAKTLVVAGTL